MKRQHINSTVFMFIALILLAICVFTGCLLLYFHGNNDLSKKATVLFSYSPNSSKLVIDSSMPITDQLGKELTFNPNQSKYGYSEFSISSNMEGMESINYEIYAKNIGVAVELPTDYVKIYLTDGNTDVAAFGYEQRVPTYRDLKIATSDPAGKKIYAGSLKKGETANFKLRMWLSDAYPITTEVRSFGILLYVKVVD